MAAQVRQLTAGRAWGRSFQAGLGRLWPAALLAIVVALPLGWVAWSAIAQGLDASAWRALLADPQLPRAAFYSVWTGLLATVLSVGATASARRRTSIHF